MDLKDKKVLVTGATGFIGGRLAERLAVEQGAVVTGLGRRLERAPHVKEAGVDLRKVDMVDSAALREVVAGQEIVFHLASAMASSSNNPEISQLVNVTATNELVRAAAEAGVGRFVHVSSMAAYGPPIHEIMSEELPVDTQQSAPYGRTKAQGELESRVLADQLGLDLAVVRPGMVFGPRGRSWTVNLLKLVQRRIPVLMGGGAGHAHPIYLDNLVDGMLLTATRPEASGEVFNFVDQPLPWREFFGYYGRMCGRKPWGLPLWTARFVLAVFKVITRRTESLDVMLINYTNRSVFPTTKAQELLGYRPQISIDEGMKRTEAWFREAGFLPATGQ